MLIMSEEEYKELEILICKLGRFLGKLDYKRLYYNQSGLKIINFKKDF